jgi:hypothetical protein
MSNPILQIFLRNLYKPESTIERGQISLRGDFHIGRETDDESAHLPYGPFPRSSDAR